MLYVDFSLSNSAYWQLTRYIWPRLFLVSRGNLLEGKGSRLDTFTAESISRNRGEFSFVPAERSRPMSFKRKWIVLVREIRLLFTLRFLLFRVKSRPLSRFKKILERILIFPFHSSFFSLTKFPLLNIRLARDFILFETCRWNTRNDRGVTRAIGTGLECCIRSKLGDSKRVVVDVTFIRRRSSKIVR